MSSLAAGEVPCLARGWFRLLALGAAVLLPAGGVAVQAQTPVTVSLPAASVPPVLGEEVPDEAMLQAEMGLPPLPAPQVKAGYAIVMDATSGQVIWGRNMHVRRPMASTTKIMTATVILESGRLDETVKFSEYARHTPYGNLNAKPGEQFPMRDLLYAIMLRSSNDGCVAAGEHLYGQAWRLAAAMNEKARQLGAVNTNFVTVNGLFDKSHYSTAYDLALITRYAIQNPMFNEVVSTRERYIRRSINQKDTLIRNHNRFLKKYDGADGIKTGYVKEAGRCLVASATRNEQGAPWRLITVVLNSPDTYGDSKNLQDWARKYFQPVFYARAGEPVGEVAVNGGAARTVALRATQDLRAVVRRDLAMERTVRTECLPLAAPVQESAPAGKLVALAGGIPVGDVALQAAAPVKAAWSAAGLAPWSAIPAGAAALILGARYVRAFTKGARRRRRRVSPRRRSAHRRREGHG